MPVLYNQDHEHFRNVAIKQKAWAEISKEFGKSGMKNTTFKFCIYIFLENLSV